MLSKEEANLAYLKVSDSASDLKDQIFIFTHTLRPILEDIKETNPSFCDNVDAIIQIILNSGVQTSSEVLMACLSCIIPILQSLSDLNINNIDPKPIIH